MADLATDPAYLAYMRALGFDESSARSNAERQRGQVEDQIAFTKPEIQFQGGIERRNISGGYEDRGLLRSGEHERGLAEQAHGQQYRLGAIDLAGASQIGDIEAALAAQLVNLRRQNAENSLGLYGQNLLTDLTRQQ